MNGEKLRIAVQNSGRLTEPSLELLAGAGLEFDAYSRRLLSSVRNFELDILFLRDDDIPEYVQDGISDLGIVGRNLVVERGADVRELEPLGFGHCRLVLAVPRESEIRAVGDLAGRRIATSYPHSLGSFLAREGLEATVVQLRGATEIAPALNVADAICDLVSTGSTLRTNDLVPLRTILDSQAVLVANPAALELPERAERIQRILVRLRALLTARRTKYIMVNAPQEAVPRIRELLPGLRSPTVVPLAEPGYVALHAAIPEERFWEVVEEIKAVGGTDVLVLAVEKLLA
ncbi:MAG: ATP phosphoribosyltransferase [Gemmatimonadetes bacterium]|nr:ATP phosphoribosyltransferase [Gemmatimonadota bacterium]